MKKTGHMVNDAVTDEFAEPYLVENIEDCHFYHTMELPGVGLQPGDWDLRESVDDYLGRMDFDGKSVMDVGTSSGFLAFEMERRGASVIGFDITLDDPQISADLIPYHDLEQRHGASVAQIRIRDVLYRRTVRNSFWLSHRLLRSSTRAYYGNVYRTPRLGQKVDITLFGNILQHLRDPLKALAAFAKITSQTIIITDTCQVDGLEYESELPLVWLRANASEPSNTHTWWQLTPGILKQYVTVLGFEASGVYFHMARWNTQDKEVRQFTVVAHRFQSSED